MRTLVGFGLSLLLATGLFAQHRGGFGNAVPPGGRPHFTAPGAVTDPTFARRLGSTVAPPGLWRRSPSVPGPHHPGIVIMYGYPVFVGGYFDNAYPTEPVPPPEQQSQQQQPPPAPAIVERFGPDDAQDPTTPTAAADDLPPVEEPASTAEPSHYLIAFKDHTVYSVVAYWVDGDTLHYFTSGNTHNQASISLVDQDLTTRLNKESGLEVNFGDRLRNP